MGPFASRFVELWRCGVHQLDDAKLGMINLFGAPSPGCLLRDRGRLSDRMIVFQDHYPIFVIFVGRFALDITKIRKPVKCHWYTPFSFFPSAISILDCPAHGGSPAAPCGNFL